MQLWELALQAVWPQTLITLLLKSQTYPWIKSPLHFIEHLVCCLINLFLSRLLTPTTKTLTPGRQHTLQEKHSDPQFSSVTQSCPTLCDPMNQSTPGLPVHQHLPEFTQTHFHRVGDAIQPYHPLSSPFPPAPNPSQHQSLFQ